MSSPPPVQEPTKDDNNTNNNNTTKTSPYPPPAYLPASPSLPSPLSHPAPLLHTLTTSPRSPPFLTHTLPPRSGATYHIPSHTLFRISLPQGPQVVDLNLFAWPNWTEHFWASRTRQLHASHLQLGARLWSCLPYLRPLATMVGDSLGARLRKEGGWGVGEGREMVHDLLGTRCDPYVNRLLSRPGRGEEEEEEEGEGEEGEEGGGEKGDEGEEEDDSDYNYHCHSNLVRAVLPHSIPESAIHDVLNLFQSTGLDDQGRYYMRPCPAVRGDYVEFFAETDLLLALSACPGGDLSLWGFGPEGRERMRSCCREVKVEVCRLVDEERVLGRAGWRESVRSGYKGGHGIWVPSGEGDERGGPGEGRREEEGKGLFEG